jgi:hypothetical protein
VIFSTISKMLEKVSNYLTVFTRLSATALFKFSELQMRRSFEGGAQLGAAEENLLFVNYNKNF